MDFSVGVGGGVHSPAVLVVFEEFGLRIGGWIRVASLLKSGKDRLVSCVYTALSVIAAMVLQSKSSSALTLSLFVQCLR